jgi:hypothetical protein
MPTAMKPQATSTRQVFATFVILSFLCGSNAWGATGYIFDGFPNKIESKYFIFYSDLPRREVQSYTEFSNLFLEVVDRDFVRLTGAIAAHRSIRRPGRSSSAARLSPGAGGLRRPTTTRSFPANGRAGSVSVAAAIGRRGYLRLVRRTEMMTALVIGFLLSL